ncbi:MAG: hypothetical protein SF052_20995 [Bacteroidia bacterium]|nr:hypothetical protein [Bacteroidia bacterium]
MSKFLRFSFSIFLGTILLYSRSSAQEYTSALGLRTGSDSGISLKHFFAENTALEGMLVYRQTGFRVVGMVEQQFFLGRHSSSALYFGLGGHLGYSGLVAPEQTPRQVAGLDFLVGFEYVFPHSPLVFAFDLKPLVELRYDPVFSGNNAAVSLRYIIR